MLGIVLGVLVAWVVQPVTYTNTKPAALRADFKDQYRALIASAYLADGDLVRARDRLMLLEDADPYRALAEQAQRTLAEGTFPQEARALGLLAIALGQPPATADASPATLARQPLRSGDQRLAGDQPHAHSRRGRDRHDQDGGSHAHAHPRGFYPGAHRDALADAHRHTHPGGALHRRGAGPGVRPEHP